MLIKSRAVKITGEETIFTGSSLFQIQSGNYLRNVGHYEHIGYIGGKPGTMKSTILRYIVAAGAERCQPFGFKLNLNGQRVVWFDGEQPRDIIVNSVNHIIELSCQEHLDYLDMYELNGISRPIDRRREMFRIVREELAYTMNTGLIIIDGLANFVNNINDFVEVGDFFDKMTTVAKRLKVMVIILSHIADLGNDAKKLYGAGGSRLDQLASWGFFMSHKDGFFEMRNTKHRYEYIAPKFFKWGKEKNELIEMPFYPW